jgi:hypothetical protein
MTSRTRAKGTPKSTGRRAFEGLYRHDGWNVGIVRCGVSALLSGRLPPIAWLPLGGRAGFAADPFLIAEGGKLYCFFEWLPYATDRGRICYVEVSGGDPRPAMRDAIVAPYHLSYPYLFRHDGEIVCIPEAGASGSVTAYAARTFPNGWYAKQTLIVGFAGVDNTVFEHEGRWWMLATDGRSGWNSDLCVWYADDLFGTWRPHAGNPVKRDLAGTRPGGRPFVVDGRLYRPAQDCTSRYGRRLIINEILELSPDRFRERAVTTIEPDPAGPYPDGLHTANAAGDMLAIDGNRLHFVPHQAARAIAARARRLPVLRSP